MEMKAWVGAAAVAALCATLSAAPAQAALITGQLDIGGGVFVQNSNFEVGGNLDFDNESGFVESGTGDFAGIPRFTFVELNDINFNVPDLVYSVSGFSFTATEYTTFDNEFPIRGFMADGTISAAGFDDTPGMLTLSTQSTTGEEFRVSFSSTTTAIPLPASALLLLSGLGGLGLLTRRRRWATA